MTTINEQFDDIFKAAWTPFMDSLVRMCSFTQLDAGLLLYVYGRESSFGTDTKMGADGPFQITPAANPDGLDVANPIIGASLAIKILIGHTHFWHFATDAAAMVLASYNAGLGTIIHADSWAGTQPEGITWRDFPGRTPVEGQLMKDARGYLTLNGRTISYGTSLEVQP